MTPCPIADLREYNRRRPPTLQGIPMKAITALFTSASIAAIAVAGNAAPSSAQYKFNLSVQLEDAPLVAIKASLPPGTTHTLQATPHLRFEVEVPKTTDVQSTTVVRLIDDSSGQARVLHTAQTSGPDSQERGLAYAVCDGRVTFYSGPGAGPPTCKGE